ncbi:MAG: hypothetical protein U9R53_01875 [Chloroflexota bacterium]|nr:hypothetical protein [Chloroflexota bacterium]
MIAEVVYGLVIVSINLILTDLILHFNYKAFKPRSNRNKTPTIIAFVFGVSAMLNILVLSRTQSTPALIHGLTTLIIMSSIAYIDLLTGHIPALSLVCSVIFGWIPYLLNDQIIQFLIGGVSNLLLGWIAYHFGVQYFRKSTNKTLKFSAFGFGDIYGLGALGFLLGFPDSIFGFFLTLILSLFGAIVTSITKKQSYLHIRVKLGGYIFLVAAIFLTLKLFDVY